MLTTRNENSMATEVTWQHRRWCTERGRGRGARWWWRGRRWRWSPPPPPHLQISLRLQPGREVSSVCGKHFPLIYRSVDYFNPSAVRASHKKICHPLHPTENNIDCYIERGWPLKFPPGHRLSSVGSADQIQILTRTSEQKMKSENWSGGKYWEWSDDYLRLQRLICLTFSLMVEQKRNWPCRERWTWVSWKAQDCSPWEWTYAHWFILCYYSNIFDKLIKCIEWI